MRALSTVIVVTLSWFAAGANAQPSTDSEQLWSALKAGGHIALMRHALAPGTGDPANFVIDDCSTQRNLSDRGREQARRIGREFRDRDIAVARVLSSLWCRCLETAELLGLGSVEPFPVLNSFFRRTERRAEQTAALREFVNRPIAGASLVLVSHQVNITALTGVFPSSGEIVVIRPGNESETFELVGRLLVE